MNDMLVPVVSNDRFLGWLDCPPHLLRHDGRHIRLACLEPVLRCHNEDDLVGAAIMETNIVEFRVQHTVIRNRRNYCGDTKALVLVPSSPHTVNLLLAGKCDLFMKVA